MDLLTLMKEIGRKLLKFVQILPLQPLTIFGMKNAFLGYFLH